MRAVINRIAAHPLTFLLYEAEQAKIPEWPEWIEWTPMTQSHQRVYNRTQPLTRIGDRFLAIAVTSSTDETEIRLFEVILASDRTSYYHRVLRKRTTPRADAVSGITQELQAQALAIFTVHVL